MEAICARFHNHTRDELVEAFDATVRHQHDGDAQVHVNRILALQAGGVPLINGKEATHVLAGRNRVGYGPMF